MDCMVTSGFGFEGHKITAYHTLVSSRQTFSGILFIKRTDKADAGWDDAVRAGISELQKHAQALGGNAVVGLHLECVNDSPLVILVLTGTAVTVERV